MDDIVNGFQRQVGLLDFQNQNVMSCPSSIPSCMVTSIKDCLQHSGAIYLRNGGSLGTSHEKENEGLSFKLCASELCCPASDQVRFVRRLRRRCTSPMPPMADLVDDTSSYVSSPALSGHCQNLSSVEVTVTPAIPYYTTYFSASMSMSRPLRSVLPMISPSPIRGQGYLIPPAGRPEPGAMPGHLLPYNPRKLDMEKHVGTGFKANAPSLAPHSAGTSPKLLPVTSSCASQLGSTNSPPVITSRFSSTAPTKQPGRRVSQSLRETKNSHQPSGAASKSVSTQTVTKDFNGNVVRSEAGLLPAPRSASKRRNKGHEKPLFKLKKQCKQDKTK